MFSNSEVVLPAQGDNIIRTKDFEYTPNPKGLAHELYTFLKKDDNALAQQDAETEETDTYKEYRQRIVRVALHLRKRGITSDDFVTPCTTTHLNSNVIYIAGILSGAKVACVDPFIAYVDGKSMVNIVKPKIMFVIPESVERTEKIIDELGLNTEIVVFGKTDKYTSFDEFLQPLSEEEETNFDPYVPNDLFETAIVIFSSGSTGIPKGICINHYTILCQTGRMMDTSMSSGSGGGLSYSPLAWASAQISAVIHIFHVQCNLLCKDFDPEKTWRYIVKYKVRSIALSPHNCIVMLKYGNPNNLETPNLRVIISAGGKISHESSIALSKIFLNPVGVLQPYGQTEVYGPVFMPQMAYIRKVDYIGNPLTGCSYKVVDPETGKICGPNEQGEICIKSKFVMNGYYNHDSSDCFDEDGYLKTGDIVYYDEDYSFFFVERYREALRYKGYWLAPTYLESILYQHPAVKIACVVGIPTDDGDVPTAIVVKDEKVQDVTEEELIQYVNDQVTELKKIRGGVIFIDESLVEFTPSGKIRRYTLRRNLEEELEERKTSLVG